MSKQSIQGDKNQNIKVYVRCRPINEQERKARNQMCIDVHDTKRAVTVKTHHDKTFTFDGTFGRESTQIDVYKTVVQPLITEVLQGYNCTVFAYGQTGTGKTYTMEGVRSEKLLSWQHDPHAGIVPRALHQIFTEAGDPGLTIIKVSFLELYNEELFDLLGSGEQQTSKLKIYEDSTAKGSVVVKGLEEVVVRDRQEVYSLMERGASRRQVAATLMNASSSRSHTIFTITVISKDTSDSGVDLMRTGKLNLVDLAGSENIGRSGAQDKRAREAGNINQSLLTLGRVITALVERTPHVPYRESKLTRLLQDSLGGRTKTSIIATISPAQINLEETLSTLEYAFRAKNIMNRPEVNQKLCKEVVLKHMTDELEQLRRDLIACREKNGVYIDETNYRTMQSRLDLQSEELQKKSEEMADMAQRMELLQAQIDSVNELFEANKKTLEIELEAKQKAQARLKEVNFNYTAAKVVIKAHQQTEEKLHQDASKLINTADLAQSDIRKLHEKVQRQHELEEHNSHVLNQLLSVFSSTLDSTNRKVDDAFLDLQKTCALKESAVNGLREESKLIQDTDCLLSALMRNQYNKKMAFLQKIATIDEQANKLVVALRQNSTDVESSLNATFFKVNEALCSDLMKKIKSSRKNLETDLDSVLGQFQNEKVSDFEINAQKELHHFTTLASDIRNKTSAEISRSKATLAAQCEQFSSVVGMLDEMRSKLTSGLVELKEVLGVQDKVADFTTKASEQIELHKDSMCNYVRQFAETAANDKATISSQIVALKQAIAEDEEEQQLTVSTCVQKMEDSIKNCQTQMSKSVRKTTDGIHQLSKISSALSEEFTTCTTNERDQLAEITQNVFSAKTRLIESGAKLSDLKNNVTDLLGHHKRYERTGSTPARRNYEIPRVLARTQPADLLQAKLQSKYEMASLEERTALDEGCSILLDVTATPEMLDFDCDENKENSFEEMRT